MLPNSMCQWKLIFYSYCAVILLENGKRITADLSQVTVVAAEVAASGGMAPIIKPLVMVVVTAAVHFVPGVGPVVGSMLSWGLSLAPVVVPAALRAMQGHDQDNTHH